MTNICSLRHPTPTHHCSAEWGVFDTSIFCCSLKRIILQQSVGIFTISGLIRCTVRFPPAFILFAFICSSSNCRVMPQGPHTNGMHLLFSLPGSGFNWMTRYHEKYAWKSSFPRARPISLYILLDPFAWEGKLSLGSNHHPWSLKPTQFMLVWLRFRGSISM